MMYTLFGSDGNLDRAAMRLQIEAMVAGGVHGIAILGLASEGNKLMPAERRALLDWTAEDLGGRRPFAVTIAEPSIRGQIEFVKAAAAVHAQWVILQPPPARGVPEGELVAFFGAVAERSELPVAIQNAPEYLGVGLSPAALRSLNRQHGNVRLLKMEASAVEIGRAIDATEGAFDVFNGRGGIEIVDTIRAGAVGVIPGGETFDQLSRIFDLMAGDGAARARAEQLYRDTLPMLVFLMESIDTLMVYGKRVLGYRLGLAQTDPRPPFTPPTELGLALAKLYAERLGRVA